VHAFARIARRASGQTRLPCFRADWVGGGPPLCAPGTTGTELVSV